MSMAENKAAERRVFDKVRAIDVMCSILNSGSQRIGRTAQPFNKPDQRKSSPAGYQNVILMFQLL